MLFTVTELVFELQPLNAKIRGAFYTAMITCYAKKRTITCSPILIPLLLYQLIESENDIFSVSDTGKLGKKFQVLPTGVEPTTFRLLVR